MTKSETINKFITEKVFGECWHKITTDTRGIYPIKGCLDCEADELDMEIWDYYSSWSAMGRLLEKLREDRKEWEKFIDYVITDLHDFRDEAFEWFIDITPQSLAEAVANFYGMEEK